jgi:N-acetylneuraminic acid mutarotase
MTLKRLLAGVLAVAACVALAAVIGSFGPASAHAEAAPWTFAQAMSQRRSYIAAAEIGGDIYAAGGMVGETGRPLDTLQRYHPPTDTWETLQRMPEPVRAAAGASLDGTLYVIGGQTEDGTGGQVYAYDVAAGAWEERAALPEPRFNHAAVALGGKIYVLGGFAGTTELDSVWTYDSASDAWAEGTPLPVPNHAFGAVVFRDEIWMIGGRRGEQISKDVWIYNPRADRWRRGPAMAKPMELLGAAVVGDQVHAVWESTYQIYDAEAGTWAQGPRSLVTRHGLKTFFVDGNLYTLGGCTTALRDSQVLETREVG